VREISRRRSDTRPRTSVLSRSAVSQVMERLWREYEALASRDLSEFQVAYSSSTAWPSALFEEQPLQQVRRADHLPMAQREPQVGDGGVEILE